MLETDNLIIKNHKNIFNSFQNNQEKIVLDLAIYISNFLKLEVNNFDKFRHDFEIDCKKAIFKILKDIFTYEQLFFIFPDVIPGFTTLVHKKINNLNNNNNNNITNINLSKIQNNKEKFKKLNKNNLNKFNNNNNNNTENQIVSNVFNMFFQKNNNMVLIIEAEDIMIAFCLVSDFENHFKEILIYNNI